MSANEAIADNYAHGSLLASIEDALAALGKTKDTVTVADLGPVDEFHIGGRLATRDFLDQLTFLPEQQILDVGCGLGGASRFAAISYQTRGSGIDITAEYIETGKVLNEWVGLADQIQLHHASALDMPFPDNHFDGGFMLHVGMNIADKRALFKELSRVLRPGSAFGIFDVMRMNKGELMYPLPWAADQKICRVASLDTYKKSLDAAGFEVSTERNRRDWAVDFFKTQHEKTAARGGPPPLSLHTLMQAETSMKIANMVRNISAGLIAPVELIANKI